MISRARRMRPTGRSAGLRFGRVAGSAAIWFLVLLGVVVTVAPFLISVYLSLIPYDVELVPYRLHIDKWTLEGFTGVWSVVNLRLFTRNSAFYATINASLTTILAVTAGYVFARLSFPFKRALWSLILAGMMVPGMVTLAPRFTMMVRWPLAGGNDLLGRGGSGFYDTWPGLLLPGLMSATSSFMMRQFFQTLPGELEDAARVDGASEWRIFGRIMLPLALPGVVTTFMFQFQGAWNELAWPTMITTSERVRTLAAGMDTISLLVTAGEGTKGFAVPIGWAQAAALMMAAPIILLFTLGQRWFVRGIAMTGIK